MRAGTTAPKGWRGRRLVLLLTPSVAVVLNLGLLGREGNRGTTPDLADGEEDLSEGNFVFHNIDYSTQRGSLVENYFKLFSHHHYQHPSA